MTTLTSVRKIGYKIYGETGAEMLWALGYQAQGRGGTKNKDPYPVLEYQQPDLLTPNLSSLRNKKKLLHL